ncbi:MAG: general stress protein, partial [Vicinamibacteria bacterium]
VGVYDTHTSAEDAIKELQKSGFNMKQLSIVGRGAHTAEEVGKARTILGRTGPEGSGHIEAA